MKILYGVQGTGNGHITRARAMATCFNAKGIEVDYLFSGREDNQYFDMDVFGRYQTYRGLSFATVAGKVSLWQSAKKLKFGQFFADVRSLDVAQYDLVLNDFEPVSAWAAKRANKQVINISHQAAFNDPSVPIESNSWLHRWFIKMFAPANLSLGVHWQPFGGTILPPFVEVERVDRHAESFYLVYLPFEKLEEITALLSLFIDEDFVIYHPDVKHKYQVENCYFNPLNRHQFLHDLQQCNGAICNAGFELSSEALTLGKKLLVKPLNGQFEQASNARVLEQMKAASVMESLNEHGVDQWLGVKTSTMVNFPSDPSPLIEWLLEGNYDQPERLCERLWQQV